MGVESADTQSASTTVSTAQGTVTTVFGYPTAKGAGIMKAVNGLENKLNGRL